MNAKRCLPSLAAALALALVSVAPGWGQAPRPSPRGPRFEVGIEVINVAVSVTDAENRFVTKLAPADFSVFEDGVKQNLTLFSHEDIPLSVLLLVDCSASMEAKLPMARAAATRFVRTLSEEDLGQVVQFNDRPTTLAAFTSDQAALEAAINRTRASGPTALHNALYIALRELQRPQGDRELRRRAIVLLSDGEDTASLVSDEQVVDLARRSEIGIYSISLSDRKRRNEDTAQSFSQARHLLTVLSRDSGGRSFFPDSLSELETVYSRVAEELRTQYNVGYVSTNPRRDGRWRRIVVRVPGREDLQVRHKVGYFAPAR